MSTHPNVMLILELQPDDLPNKTHRTIMSDLGITSKDDEIIIGSEKYYHFVAESDYNDSFQISTTAGNIVIFDLVTDGYGECIAWDKLLKQKTELEDWAKSNCPRLACSFSIKVGANYW
jgi:hypothetical protein